MNLHLRKISGSPFNKDMETEIVIKALEDASLKRELLNNCMVHTDLGSQYTSAEYEKRLKELGISHSYSCKGCPYDNAGIESFHASLKKEHVYQRSTYSMFEETKTQLFSYVQGFYATRKIHRALAYLTPSQLE